MVAGFAQTLGCQLLNVLYVGLFRRPVRVGVEALVRFTIEWLRVLALPGRDFVFVHPHRAVLNPRLEAL